MSKNSRYCMAAIFVVTFCVGVSSAPLDATATCGISSIAQRKSVVEERSGIETDKGQKVVGGVEAIPNSWPWQVYVSAAGFGCGGTIITNEWVMTAAHCCIEGDVVPPSNVFVTVAEHNLTDPADGVLFNVSSVVVHPLHVSFEIGDYYDFCLLKLTEPLTFSEKVAPACLNTGSNYLETAGTSCQVTGWGRTVNEGNTSRVLLQAETAILDQARCTANYAAAYPPIQITQDMICAASPGRDTCEGDSGGPLVCQDPSTKVWTLVGVTSFGIGCADPNFPGVYGRISFVLDFINQTITEKHGGY